MASSSPVSQIAPIGILPCLCPQKESGWLSRFREGDDLGSALSKTVQLKRFRARCCCPIERRIAEARIALDTEL